MKHLLPSMVTAKVHIKQIRKNIKSTKTPNTPPTEDKTINTLETRSNHVFTKIINPQQQIENDLTRRFPVTSNRGNKSLFILYEYNRNIILVRPMNNRTDKYFIHVLQDMHQQLITMVLKPNYM